MSTGEHLLTALEQLEALYGKPQGGAVIKEIDHINESYRKLIEAAPFDAIATSGPEGLRPGNNRIDGFRNIVRDPRIALQFLIPGVGETLRVNGRVSISVAPDLLQRFVVNGKLPLSVILIQVETVYFHCAKASIRSKLWDEGTKIDRKSLPSTGTIIGELSHGKLGGEQHDREMQERHKAQLY